MEHNYEIKVVACNVHLSLYLHVSLQENVVLPRTNNDIKNSLININFANLIKLFYSDKKKPRANK